MRKYTEHFVNDINILKAMCKTLFIVLENSDTITHIKMTYDEKINIYKISYNNIDIKISIDTFS